MNRKKPSSGGNPRKKLTIKPFKAPVAPPPDHFATSANLLVEASRAILQKRDLSTAKLSSRNDPTSVLAMELCTSREELYRLVESLCLGKEYGAKLFDLLEKEIRNAAQVILAKLEGKQHAGNDSSSLDELLLLYDEYSQYVFYIRNIFLPLDRSFKKNIFEVGKVCFRELVVKQNLFHKVIVPNLMVAFQDLRTESGETLQQELTGNKREGLNKFTVVVNLSIKKCVQMMRELLFFDEFEEIFLKESKKFYLDDGNTSVFDSMELSDYLIYVKELLAYNGSLCGVYFNCTKFKLASVLEECLVKASQGKMLGERLTETEENPFYSLLDNVESDNKSSLSIAYDLLRKINGLEAMKNRIEAWGKLRGLSFINDGNPIPNLVQLHGKLCKIAVIIEKKSITKDIMESVLNEGRENKIPHALAKQFNAVLSKKEHTELETLSSIFTLFTYLVNKDVFGAHYRRFLGRRLLHGSSKSLDIERSMLGKLKGECGAQYTAKLEGMYNDIELATNLRQQYYDFVVSDSSFVNPVEFEPTVLTTGYWQQPVQHKITIPDHLQKHMNHYNEYYTSKYAGRRIVWQHSLGFIHLKAKFPESKSPYQIVLTEYMGLIMLLFNSEDNETTPSLTVQQIMESTNLPLDEVIRSLISLSKGAKDKTKNHRLLSHQKHDTTSPRDGVQGGILPDDSFTVNRRFKSKTIRMKIPLLSTKQEVATKQAQEEEQVTEALNRDRASAIDAAIVRLLKTRKVIKHQELITELMESGMLKFSFQPSDVKKRIESLIEREYLERSPENRNVYNYLA